ncbi:hypothetical protein BDY24DRAFT_392890 [Mrakia frigida]|uniref:AN1-type zinc finger protein n=1 Tax=Mrakia frigida TaxID=29902 RepID=UPI003FCBF54C
MDLAPIGSVCYSCNTLDLLPLTCPYCHNVFCKLHSSTNHPCPTSSSNLYGNKSSAGGPSSSRGERCEVAGCELKKMRTWVLPDGSVPEGSSGSGSVLGDEVKCEQCGGGFCLSHRTPISHYCNPPTFSLTPQQLLTKSLISTHFQPTPPTTSTPSVPTAPKKKRKALSPAIELLRIQQGAVPGRGEVRERKDRWHLRAGIDLEGKVVGREDTGEAEELGTGKEGEKGVYFRRDLTVAQVLQSILTSKKIQYNPVAGDPSSLIHLVAFLPSSGFSNGLPTSSVLDRTKRIDQCGIIDGGRVWVVRGEGVWTRG